MQVNNSLTSYNNISSFFNTLSQGRVSMMANQLSNSKFLFPENIAPGKGTFGTDAVSYINELKTASKDLSGALRSLSGGAFNQRGVVSSDTDVMTVKYSGSSAGLNSMQDMKVKVDQLAAGQVNEGSALKAKDAYTGSTGTNRFAIETGGKTTQLSINVSATDTNRTVQDKMAKAINDAGLGLKAMVETDSKTGTSMLRVESQNTGSDAKNAFTIKDVTGNAVARTGAGNRVSEGQDAIYSVNGGAAQTSKTNTVNLGNGITATLKAASDEAVTVSRGRESSQAISAVRDMVSSYNKLFNASASNVGDPKAQSLASKLVNVSSVYSRSLSEVGISFDNSGRMTIDEDKMNKAAESGALERFFTQDSGRNYGFANQLGRIADSVSSNTSAYISSNLFSDNFGYSGFNSPSMLSAMRSGSIFDYSF